MGKSTAAKIAQSLGAAVVDTDVIAREIVMPGQPALEQVKARFGADMIDQHGQLRRHELARRVFADADARHDLETILHPRIREVWLSTVEQWRDEGRSLGVVVIPLLFETGAEKYFDATICVACSVATQQQRLTERGWSAAEIEQRRQAQWPVEKKMLLANYVIWTEGELPMHTAQWKRILRLQ